MPKQAADLTCPRKAQHDPEEPDTIFFLNQEELARRWRISPRTLERWRCRKTGPAYYRLGSKIGYLLTDVEAYERRRRAETHSSILGSWR